MTLDFDLNLRAALREAGLDPAMQRVQDDYLDRNFFQPALTQAKINGLQHPLSQGIVYDAHIQGGWKFCSQTVNQTLGAIGLAVSEESWIIEYLKIRTAYLQKVTIPDTSYRMVAYGTVVGSNNWTLALPFTFHGVSITEESFGAPATPPVVVSPPIPDPEADNLPLLRPQIPYTRGPEVLNLQKLLNAAGLTNTQDQVYGPFTQTLVSSFQKRKQMKADAIVGPQTWAVLIASAAASQ
jgi:Glycosyl hydrolase family 46/Putative peptidoglycan binding domain